MEYQRIIKLLKKCEIKGGFWIDAGCGNGTFTFPLATLSDQVLAIDKNKQNLNYLKSLISTETNIILQQTDFNEPNWYDQLVDGIFFGFSLHYHPIHKLALVNAYNQLKKGGMIIIFEYASGTPVSWVPHPLPQEKLTSLFTELSYMNIQLIETIPARRKGTFWNNSSYLIKAEKSQFE